MNNTIDKFLSKKYTVAGIILAIMIGAFFVRFYHFHDWLYFKMDQSRDAFLIGNAIKNGPGNLPLLGARAGATEVSRGFLRLGPAFYYFQYLSGVFFSSTKPDVFAYPDLFFSILTIPLLYAFSRLYFNRRISILIAAMYAFSFIIIQYSRFAWNCNSLQFFAILSFYGLLRFLGSEKLRERLKWLSIWTLGLAIGSQLHFFGFFGLVGISGMMILADLEVWKVKNIPTLISNKKNISNFLKYLAVTIGIFAIIYLPVIISDVMKHGENSLNFIEALHTKPSPQSIGQKFVKNITEETRYYTLITTSYVYGANDRTNALASCLVAAMMLLGIGIIIKKIKKKDLKKTQRNFLLLVLVWTGVFFTLSIPVAFQLRPRFFILVFALPFILLGIIFDFFEKSSYTKKYFAHVSVILSFVILLSNGLGTSAWFSEQKRAEQKNTPIERSLILKAKDGVMLGQLERAARWIYGRKKPDARIYYYVKPEHIKPVKYIFHEIDPGLEALPLELNGDPKAQFFAITPAQNGTKPIEDKFGQNFAVISQNNFGQISAWEISFTGTVINKDFRFNKNRGASDRLYWKDVFGIKDEAGSELIDNVE
jgi:hypothetical protein